MRKAVDTFGARRGHSPHSDQTQPLPPPVHASGSNSRTFAERYRQHAAEQGITGTSAPARKIREDQLHSALGNRLRYDDQNEGVLHADEYQRSRHRHKTEIEYESEADRIFKRDLQLERLFNDAVDEEEEERIEGYMRRYAGLDSGPREISHGHEAERRPREAASGQHRFREPMLRGGPSEQSPSGDIAKRKRERRKDYYESDSDDEVKTDSPPKKVKEGTPEPRLMGVTFPTEIRGTERAVKPLRESPLPDLVQPKEKRKPRRSWGFGRLRGKSDADRAIKPQDIGYPIPAMQSSPGLIEENVTRKAPRPPGWSEPQPRSAYPPAIEVPPPRRPVERATGLPGPEVWTGPKPRSTDPPIVGQTPLHSPKERAMGPPRRQTGQEATRAANIHPQSPGPVIAYETVGAARKTKLQEAPKVVSTKPSLDEIGQQPVVDRVTSQPRRSESCEPSRGLPTHPSVDDIGKSKVIDRRIMEARRSETVGETPRNLSTRPSVQEFTPRSNQGKRECFIYGQSPHKDRKRSPTRIPRKKLPELRTRNLPEALQAGISRPTANDGPSPGFRRVDQPRLWLDDEIDDPIYSFKKLPGGSLRSGRNKYGGYGGYALDEGSGSIKKAPSKIKKAIVGEGNEFKPPYPGWRRSDTKPRAGGSSRRDRDGDRHSDTPGRSSDKPKPHKEKRRRGSGKQKRMRSDEEEDTELLLSGEGSHGTDYVERDFELEYAMERARKAEEEYQRARANREREELEIERSIRSEYEKLTEKERRDLHKEFRAGQPSPFEAKPSHYGMAYSNGPLPPHELGIIDSRVDREDRSRREQERVNRSRR